MSSVAILGGGVAETPAPIYQNANLTGGNPVGAAAAAAAAAAASGIGAATTSTGHILPDLLMRLQEQALGANGSTKPIPAAAATAGFGPNAGGAGVQPLLLSFDPDGDGVTEESGSTNLASQVQSLKTALDPRVDNVLGAGNTQAEKAELGSAAPPEAADGGSGAVAEAQAQALIMNLTSLNAQMQHLSVTGG